MGGKNEVSNITPIHAEKHYDRQGVHSPDSSYSRLDKALGDKKMKIENFYEKLIHVKINSYIVDKVQTKYQCNLNDYIKKSISLYPNGEFFESDDILRLLSVDEIMSAKEELHVDFINKKIIPMFDIGENNFIVYNYSTMKWGKFNIIDEIFYNENELIEKII